MSLLRLDASIQGDQSASTALADTVVAEVMAARPGTAVVSRHLGKDPLPADAWAHATSGGFVAESERTPQQRAALDLAAALADEVRAADAFVLAMPLYNYGVSQHAKTWIDLVTTGAGAGVPVLEGKPTVLVTTRGGSYGEGSPRAGWDHNTDYLRRILADLWLADLTVVEREFTLVGVNPALDEFSDVAAVMAKQAEQDAVAAGRALAAR
ncbi:FMN-dependent NADH-azoreductase [Isoptericola sp. QY 916]|uniref:FMN-dependent NADH-azoreductase n=1 Tax=Isoptericola sp. QY 916 TaxID=2782570 RepID=UPI003D2FEEAA|nr:NAD(P)H-dependent oxidoreductase [Isoptericola sp. QY 916]